MSRPVRSEHARSPRGGSIEVPLLAERLASGREPAPELRRRGRAAWTLGEPRDRLVRDVEPQREPEPRGGLVECALEPGVGAELGLAKRLRFREQVPEDRGRATHVLGRAQLATPRDPTQLREARREPTQRRGLLATARAVLMHEGLRRAHDRERRHRRAIEDRSARDHAAGGEPEQRERTRAVHEVQHPPLDRKHLMRHGAHRREAEPGRGDEARERERRVAREAEVLVRRVGDDRDRHEGEVEREPAEEGATPAPRDWLRFRHRLLCFEGPLHRGALVLVGRALTARRSGLNRAAGFGPTRGDCMQALHEASLPGSTWRTVATPASPWHSRAMALGLALVVTFPTLADTNGPIPAGNAGAPTRSWLDREHPAGWNQPGAAIPDAPPPTGESATTERCRRVMRAPTLAGDQSVVAKGWTLFGPGHVFGATEVVLAASSVDGMCRPLGFQGFVFVDGQLAGMISPRLMESRTDGAANVVHLRSSDLLDVEFARYAPKDPLCCPSRVTTVAYRVQLAPHGPVLVAIEARTSPAAPRR